MKTTKVTILGEYKTEPELKKIEFVHCIGDNLLLRTPAYPKDWENIVLIRRKHHEGLDLMYAYSGETDNGYLYLGHFNDGVV